VKPELFEKKPKYPTSTRKKIGIVCFFCVFLSSFFAIQTLRGSNSFQSTIMDVNSKSAHIVSQSYIPHEPIFIDGNSGWESFPNKTGSGTLNDPYIIENLEINAGETGSGIWIQDSSVYVEIINCALSNSGWRLGDAGIELRFSSNIKIINCSTENDQRGIYLLSSYDNTLSGNTISNTHERGIYLRSSYDNILSGNTIRDNNEIGIQLYWSSFNTLSGNTAIRNGDDGIVLEHSFSNILFGNTAADNGMSGYSLSDSSHNTLSENTARSNDFSGIELVFACGNNILSNNIASDNNQFGIRLDTACRDNTLSGNIVSENAQSGIILSAYSGDNNLSGNICSFNGQNGIESYTSGNRIQNNTITINTLNGLYLGENSNGNFIHNNTISNNTLDGILMYSANGNEIWNNVIGTNGDYEIKLQECSNNTIHDNDILSDNLREIKDIDGTSNDIYDNNRPFRRKFTNTIIFSSVGGVSICAIIFIVIQIRKRRKAAADAQRPELEAKLDELKKYVDYAKDKVDMD